MCIVDDEATVSLPDVTEFSAPWEYWLRKLKDAEKHAEHECFAG